MSDSSRSLDARKVLITGAAGFIGRNLVEALSQSGCVMHLVVKKTSDLWRLQHGPEATIHFADLTKYSEVDRLFQTLKPEFVIHLASRGKHLSSIFDLPDFLDHNARSTSNLLEAARAHGVTKFVFGSSSLTYGSAGIQKHEDQRPFPDTLRGIVKATEELLSNYYSIQSLSVVSLRIFHAYGPWEQPDRFIPKIISSFIRRDRISLANPRYQRDYVFVEDVTRALVDACLTTIPSGKALNLGTGVRTSARDVFDTLQDIFGYSIEVEDTELPAREGDLFPYAASTENVEQYLKWTPHYSLKEGLNKTVNWFKNNMHYYAK